MLALRATHRPGLSLPLGVTACAEVPRQVVGESVSVQLHTACSDRQSEPFAETRRPKAGAHGGTQCGPCGTQCGPAGTQCGLAGTHCGSAGTHCGSAGTRCGPAGTRCGPAG